MDEFSIGGRLSLTKFHQFVKTERLFNLEKRHKLWYLTDDPSKVEELSSLTSNFDILLKGVGGEAQSTFQKLLKSS